MNATVTLPLSEIDALRNDFEKALKEKNDLEATQMKIRVEVHERISAYQSAYDGYGNRYMKPEDNWRVYPHYYINMDDVINPLRDELRLEMEKQLVSKDKALIDIRDQYNYLDIKSS